jgi:hypothetical protein
MKTGQSQPGITIFTGRFGSGKTEVSINYALAVARRQQVPEELSAILIDLDIVTPYFRSRETADQVRALGVQVVAPSIIGRQLDTPAITPQILGAIQQAELPVVLDVGGDKQGARALGQFGEAIRQRRHVMHFVVNPYRPFTGTAEGLARSIDEIEASSRLRVTSLVSNPNIMGETSPEQILNGQARIEDFAQRVGLPIAFVCIERRWATELGPDPFGLPTLTLKRYFAMPWEESLTESRESYKERE